jgi:hypothetical protein
MQPICKSFRRNKDGSWICISGISFSVPGGKVDALTGKRYEPGTLYAGLDIVGFLNKSCKAAARTK